MTFVCDRCGTQLEGKEIQEDLFLPVDGFLVWTPSAEIALCETCSRDRGSWPWWGAFGQGADELLVLYARYDSQEYKLPPGDRCWN